MRPHCFSHAASFFPTAKLCKSCPFNIACAQAVLERLKALNARVDVADMVVDTQRFLDQRQIPIVPVKLIARGRVKDFDVEMDLSKCGVRARKLAVAILRRGINIKADLSRGENSLRDFKPKHLALIHDALAEKGFVTHEEVKKMVRQISPNIKSSAVSNCASWTVSALIAMKVIEKYGERYVLTN